MVAVFIPVAFLGGMTGQLYKQFAVTIAISVVFSGIVALTLSPALAAILIKPGHGEKHGFFKWFEKTLERATNGYVAGSRWIMHHTVDAVIRVLVKNLLLLQIFSSDCFHGSAFTHPNKLNIDGADKCFSGRPFCLDCNGL